jgi:hypothetical protein
LAGPVTFTVELVTVDELGDPGGNQATAAVAARPAQPGAITGALRGASGPAAGVWVMASRADGSPWDTVAAVATDAEGRYRFDGLAPGPYRLRYIDYEGRYESGWSAGAITPEGAAVHRLVSGTTLVVDITLVPSPTGAVVGDVTGRDGARVPGLWVLLMDTRGGVVATTYTGGDGVFLFGGVRDGTYRVLLWDVSGAYGVQYLGGGPGSFAAQLISVRNGQVAFAHGALR